MINKRKGNILNIEEGYIVHGCNAQGVMGSGIAKQIREKYPKVYSTYLLEYNENGLAVGSIIPVYINEKLCIINAITQEFYGRNPYKKYVSYFGVDTCFNRINRLIQTDGTEIVNSLHFPLIGCGLANGNWDIVSKKINKNIANNITKTLWIL